MYRCVKKVIIEGVIPCMPHRSLILASRLSSSIPQIPIHGYIKKITYIQLYIYIYIYIRKS